LEIALRFPHPQPTGEVSTKFFLPGLLANNRDGTTVEPDALLA